MIARLRPLPPIELVDATVPDASGSSGTVGAARLVALAGFFCFMPYIAVAVGHTTAVQAGSVVSVLLILPILVARKVPGPLWVAPLLVVPLLLSALKVGIADRDLELCLKTISAWILPLLTVTAIQLCAPQYALELMTGIAAATVVHVLVGAWQYYCFSMGEFPLSWMYGNPSFLSVQDNMDTIAKYTQRPFGIFPEPSAMSSSLAPWVLFWIAELCGIVRLRREPAPWQRILFATAAVGGLALIILSRSGHSAITMAGVLLFVAIWFSRCQATRKSYLAIIAVFGVAMPVTLYFAGAALSDRLGGNSDLGNSSWEDRTESLVIGFNQWMDGEWQTVLFGIGAGLASPILSRIARLEAVWSVLLTYVYETGLVGALAVTCVSVYLARLWKSVRFDLALAAIFVAWLVGVTVTTSYVELLPLWVALGWMTVWPAICRPVTEEDLSIAVSPLMMETQRPKRIRPRLAVEPELNWVPPGWREAQFGTEGEP